MSWKRIAIAVVLGIALVLWMSGMTEAIRRNGERIERVEAAVLLLRAGICHEMNMNTSRPSSGLNDVECIRFLNIVSKDLRNGEGGAGLTWTLTPSPTPCDQRVNWCPQPRR